MLLCYERFSAEIASQELFRPIIFIGHSLGGIVIKQVSQEIIFKVQDLTYDIAGAFSGTD